MKLEERIDTFTQLGELLRSSLAGENNSFSRRLSELISAQYLINAWFTPENVSLAITAIARELTRENLVKWTSLYPELDNVKEPLRVGIVMAGNIPLAGFHDFMCVLISGNSILARTSTKDPELIPFLGETLCSINPEFNDRILFSEGALKGFDAVIATGSDNSSRYFQYYFGRYPHIIRKNRNSLAIIEGNETGQQLEALGRDVFSYFGLGCRNVSGLRIPVGYDLDAITNNWDKFADIINHSKYAANYDFSKAVYLVNKESFTDTGYVLLKESSALSSPVAVLHYNCYSDPEEISSEISLNRERIQCITGRNFIPFGDSQFPHLWDYADGIDTLDFLLKKNCPGIM